jgi:hypothetical protein
MLEVVEKKLKKTELRRACPAEAGSEMLKE